MKQVLIIHGGNTFKSYEAYRKYLDEKTLNYEKLTHPIRWKERLFDNLPDYDVIYPSMPNSQNAVYEEWKILFEKILDFLEDDIQIIGHSLGAMFLTKYLNDNTLVRPARRLLLIAGGYDDEKWEDFGDFKIDSAKNLIKSAEEIHLFHSKDDPVVPFTELAKFQADLPGAISHIFEDRSHFIGTDFPELLELIKNS